MKAKCIEKIRDKNNHIIEYKLIDNNKNVTSVKSDELKKAIKSGQIEVINLTLTSDNRLIDKNTNTSSKPINTDIESMLNKLKSLGYIINVFGTYCKHKCYIASSTDHLKHWFIIPDDVEYIYKLSDKEVYNKKLYKYMSHIEGALKVVGGKNLISARHMFHYCKAQSIDLESFTTSNVTNMNNMFYGCKAKYLDLSSLDTSNVKSMGWMFGFCAAQSIDLSSFDTGNVIDMIGMFGDCKAQSIDLRSFDTSNVENMAEMFASCKAQYIDLTSFNTSNVTDMDGMFWECTAQVNVNDPKLKYQLQCDRG